LNHRRILTLPFKRLIQKRLMDGHYWEIGARRYSLANITAEIERVGFKIEDTYRVWEVPYHRFWRLRCQK
jgi:hypothetical protein